MNLIVQVSIVLCLVLSTSFANEDRERYPSVKKAIDSFGKVETKEVSAVDKFKNMFKDAKVSGQVRAVGAGYKQSDNGENSNYATAIGGMLKYELASLNGFNGAVAFTTSQDVGFATGNGTKHNPELSSTAGSYTELSEAYINYKYDSLNLRAGRQVLDTPLADSDDIRMIPNTFEAYTLSYEIENFSLLASNIQYWQGTDAGLDDSWVKVGDNGVSFAGLSYAKGVEASLWYYNIPMDGEATNAVYFDLGFEYAFSDEITLYTAVQYLNESEVDNSGVEADIYGLSLEGVAYGIGLNIAYNKSMAKAGKRSFSGLGGGSLFTSMDTMIIDEIAQDRDADALVVGLVYSLDNWNFLYAYGSFKGDANSAGEKADIVEQNIGFEYSLNEEFVLAALYVLEEDKQNDAKTEDDWNRAQLMVKYDF